MKKQTSKKDYCTKHGLHHGNKYASCNSKTSEKMNLEVKGEMKKRTSAKNAQHLFSL